MTTTARLGTFILVALLAAGCATPHPGAQPPGQEPSPQEPGPAPCIEPALLEADPSFYRDAPVYGPHDQPHDLLEAATAWAGRQGGFEEAWFDHDHLGWIHLGFAGAIDVDALQAAVEQEFPGDGVVVVHVPFTTEELTAVADRAREAVLAAGGTLAGSSANASSGQAALYAVAPGAATVEALEAFADEPLCVDMLPADALIEEGPQPTEGDGWRLLGHEQGVGDIYRTGIASDAGQLAELWDESGLPGAPGAVDWEREVVVWFGAVYGSTCPIRLDGVAVTGSVLHGQIVIPGWPGACTEDANAHSFVVAVERSLLPAAPFHVQLGADDPQAGVPEERTTVEVDLRSPGATT